MNNGFITLAPGEYEKIKKEAVKREEAIKEKVQEIGKKLRFNIAGTSSINAHDMTGDSDADRKTWISNCRDAWNKNDSVNAIAWAEVFLQRDQGTKDKTDEDRKMRDEVIELLQNHWLLMLPKEATSLASLLTETELTRITATLYEHSLDVLRSRNALQQDQYGRDYTETGPDGNKTRIYCGPSGELQTESCGMIAPRAFSDRSISTKDSKEKMGDVESASISFQKVGDEYKLRTGFEFTEESKLLPCSRSLLLMLLRLYTLKANGYVTFSLSDEVPPRITIVLNREKFLEMKINSIEEDPVFAREVWGQVFDHIRDNSNLLLQQQVVRNAVGLKTSSQQSSEYLQLLAVRQLFNNDSNEANELLVNAMSNVASPWLEESHIASLSAAFVDNNGAEYLRERSREVFQKQRDGYNDPFAIGIKSVLEKHPELIERARSAFLQHIDAEIAKSPFFSQTSCTSEYRKTSDTARGSASMVKA